MICLLIKTYFLNSQKILSFLSVMVIIFFASNAKAQILTVKTLPNQAPEFTVGNIDGTRTNIDSFKLQKEIRVTKGYKFKSASVYFLGANFQNVKSAFLDTSSLNGLDALIKKCVAGSVVTFDSVKVIDKKGIEISIAGKSYVFYSGEYNISIALSEANKEIFELIGKDFISGTIYFSGGNFPNVITILCKDMETKKSLFARCGPGSVISFDNCVYKNTNGTSSKPVSKSLKME